jgi:hypothetical protein
MDCCLYFSFSLSAVRQGGGAAHTMEKVHPPLMLFHLSSRASVVSQVEWAKSDQGTEKQCLHVGGGFNCKAMCDSG